MVCSTSQAGRAPKKSLIELKRHLDEGFGPPILLTEGRVIDRFGWTFDELDLQDSGRTFQTLTMLNIADMYNQVLNAVAHHTTNSLSVAHWEAYKLLVKAEGEDDVS